MAAKEGAALSGAASGAAAGTAILPGWGTAIGAVVGGIGGFMSGSAQDDATNKAKQQYEEMLQRMSSINIPDIEKQKIALRYLESQGTLTPELQQAVLSGPSAVENIQIDPRLRQDQASNLAMMQQIAESGGFDPSQRADIAQAMRQMQQQAQAQASSAEQGSEMRGMASSGANLVLQQMAGQQEANRAGDIGQKLAAAAYQNKLNSLSGASNLASNLRTQDYNEQSSLASARDRINQMNNALSNNTNAANVNLKNQTAAANLAEKQRLADANVNTSNAEQKYNKSLIQQNFENQITKAGGQNTAGMKNADFDLARAGQIGDQFSGTMRGISQLAGAYKDYNPAKPTDSGFKMPELGSNASNVQAQPGLLDNETDVYGRTPKFKSMLGIK